MKILFVQLESTGGIQLYTAKLASALSETQEVHFLLGDRLMNGDYYSQKIRFHLVHSPLSYTKMFLLSINPLTYFKIWRLIRSINPDIIHIANPFLWIVLVLPFLKKYAKVVTEHDPTLHSGTSLIVQFYIGLSTKLMRKMVDAVIVHGAKMKQIVVDSGVEDKKVWIMPHGEFSFYDKWAKEDVKETKSALYFGSIREYKGIEYLIEAAPLIISLVPDAKIIIAGNGDLGKYMPKEVDERYYEIHNRFIPDDEVAGFFQRAAVVVLPYTGGTQSGVIPVAYSFGKPVVVTNVGSIAEAVEEGKTGFIVPPKNAKAIAEATAMLLKDEKLRKKMGDNALAKSGELSWATIAEKTLEIYREAIERH
jgi:alpha-maltose-1-phosphate synthase